MKDLSRLGRELSKVIIVDNSPASYIFHPENAVSRRDYNKWGGGITCLQVVGSSIGLPSKMYKCSVQCCEMQIINISTQE